MSYWENNQFIVGTICVVFVAIGPYRASMVNLTTATNLTSKQDAQNSSATETKKVSSGKPSWITDSYKQTSPNLKSSPVTVDNAGDVSAVGIPGSWTCHKCGNYNMASKARCSTCQVRHSFTHNTPLFHDSRINFLSFMNFASFARDGKVVSERTSLRKGRS